MNSPRRRSTATSARNSSGRQFNRIIFSVPFLHFLLKCHPVKGVHTEEEYVSLLGRLDRCLPSSALGGTRRWLGGRRHRRNGRQGRLGGWAHRHARPPSSAVGRTANTCAVASSFICPADTKPAKLKPRLNAQSLVHMYRVL